MAGKSGASDKKLAGYIKERVETVPPFSTESCIFVVPVYLRSINPACYTPKLISLGPLHHGNENLKSMEAYKVRYLHALLHKFPRVQLEDLIKCLRSLEERARNCYEDNFTFGFTSDQFVELMLLDGCFIIMVLLFCSGGSAPIPNDPIFFARGRFGNIYYDMMLLENQMPYFVLEQLYVCINGSDEEQELQHSFSVLTDRFVEHEVQYWDPSLHVTNPDEEVKHFVDYMLKRILPSETNEKQQPQIETFGHKVRQYVRHILNGSLPSQVNQTPEPKGRDGFNLPSATELHQAGIHFSRGKSTCFLDIQITNGVIEIPTLTLDDQTEVRFRNWIAMEQYHKNGTCHMTDYMQLMDGLINTPNDVAFLRSCKIIVNLLGSDEDAVQMFNSMLKGVSIVRQSHYYQIFLELNIHYNKQWNLWKAKLRQDYFNTPWAIISFNAAIVLLVCTLVQTLFTVLSLSR